MTRSENMEHVAHLQRMANESWIGSPERAALDAAIASLSAPQPPAEAMEAWHSAVDNAAELRANAPDERYASRAARVESWIKANRPAPPSEPVGLEGPLSVFSAGEWRYSETGQTFSAKDLDEAAFVVYRDHLAQQGGA